MWIKHLFLGFIGLASGVGVAAGTFAFIIVIGVVPRMIAKCNRAESTILFENMIVLGGIFGTIMSVFTDISLPVGHCIAVALAEILNTFPIIFRRFQIKEGLSWIMLFMAFGKCAGAFWYFGHHMTPP